MSHQNTFKIQTKAMRVDGKIKKNTVRCQTRMYAFPRPFLSFFREIIVPNLEVYQGAKVRGHIFIYAYDTVLIA